MSYSSDITTNGELCEDKVLRKMNTLRDMGIAYGTPHLMAVNFAFEYGRSLLGFDMAEAWRMAHVPTTVGE